MTEINDTNDQPDYGYIRGGNGRKVKLERARVILKRLKELERRFACTEPDDPANHFVHCVNSARSVVFDGSAQQPLSEQSIRTLVHYGLLHREEYVFDNHTASIIAASVVNTGERFVVFAESIEDFMFVPKVSLVPAG